SAKLRYFNLQNLTNVAWSYSHLKVCDDLLSEALTLVFSRRANFGLKAIQGLQGFAFRDDYTLLISIQVTCLY
ncbi:unnamed protein product, partial [Symbiodinium sp. KB8]